MAIPKLNSCCLCFSLETGCLILGWIELIFGLIGAICYLLVIVGVVDVSTIDAHGKAISTAVGTTSFVLLLITSLVVALAGLCLILGVYKRRANLVQISLVVKVITVILYIITVVIAIVSKIKGEQVDFISPIITAILEAYFAWVVYSMYLELKGGTVSNY